MQGNGGARFGAEFVGPHACAVDDHVSANFALGGTNAHGFAVFNQNFFNRCVFKDPCASALGAFGQGLRGIDRIGSAIFGQVNAAHHIVNAHAWPQAGNFAGRERLDFEPKALGHGGATLEFFKSGLVGGNGNRASLAKAGGLASFFFERFVQVGGVLR